MTNNEIASINLLRSKGYGYKRIAAELGLSSNSVKSYIQRHPTGKEANFSCEECGKTLIKKNPKKKKRFCNDSCRMAWWKKHPEQMKHNTLYPHTCECCGAEFTSPRKDTRFCNRKCYADYRRKESL